MNVIGVFALGTALMCLAVSASPINDEELSELIASYIEDRDVGQVNDLLGDFNDEDAQLLSNFIEALEDSGAAKPGTAADDDDDDDDRRSLSEIGQRLQDVQDLTAEKSELKKHGKDWWWVAAKTAACICCDKWKTETCCRLC